MPLGPKNEPTIAISKNQKYSFEVTSMIFRKVTELNIFYKFYSFIICFRYVRGMNSWVANTNPEMGLVINSS